MLYVPRWEHRFESRREHRFESAGAAASDDEHALLNGRPPPPADGHLHPALRRACTKRAHAPLPSPGGLGVEPARPSVCDARAGVGERSHANFCAGTPAGTTFGADRQARVLIQADDSADERPTWRRSARMSSGSPTTLGRNQKAAGGSRFQTLLVEDGTRPPSYAHSRTVAAACDTERCPKPRPSTTPIGSSGTMVTPPSLTSNTKNCV
jgi:hypothetical protein